MIIVSKNKDTSRIVLFLDTMGNCAVALGARPAEGDVLRQGVVVVSCDGSNTD